MRKYIQDLTDNLIGKNRYDDLLRRIKDKVKFVEHVKLDLESGDIQKMTPETLGKIMCSLELGDVMASKVEILKKVVFGGDCNLMLRELVSQCLAFVIRDRLDPIAEEMGFPPYRRSSNAA